MNCSINHVVCHGVSDLDEIICDGDILNFDIKLEKNGFIADSSKTYLIGNASSAARWLVGIAQEALWQGIERCGPGSSGGHRSCNRTAQHMKQSFKAHRRTGNLGSFETFATPNTDDSCADEVVFKKTYRLCPLYTGHRARRAPKYNSTLPDAYRPGFHYQPWCRSRRSV